MKRKIPTQKDINKLAKLYLRDCYSHKKIASIMDKSTTWCVRALKENGLFLEKDENQTKQDHDVQKRIKWNNGNIILSKKKIVFETGKNYKAVCKHTGKEFLDYKNISGSLTMHLKSIGEKVPRSKYKRKNIESTTGKPWYYESFLFMEDNDPVLKCKKCNWNTKDINNDGGSLTRHITSSHNISIMSYTQDYPEQKHLFKTALEKELYSNRHKNSDKSNYVKCMICSKRLSSITNSHLKLHGITHRQYKKMFSDASIISESTAESLSIIATQYNTSKNTYKPSKIEKKFKKSISTLKGFGFQQNIGGYIYDIKNENDKVVIEIDGDYWHGHDRVENFSYSQIFNFLRDVKKNKCAIDNGYKIFRVTEGVINSFLPDHFHSKDELKKFLYKYDFKIKGHRLYNLKEFDVIMSKDYCKRNHKIIKENKNDIVLILLEFWKTIYHPKNYIKKCIDLSRRHQKSSYLKGVMAEAYFRSHKKKGDTLLNMFKNDEILKKTIEYRLGLNSSKEFFDISIMQLYRGLEVRTMYNVGVFPISKARKIYKDNTVPNNIIFDPFCGWGSRMLACTELGGYYYGNDINKKLSKGYTRLIKDKDLISSCKISFENSKDLKPELIKKVDFIFTSPPFYDDEIYNSNQKKYKTFDKWMSLEMIPIFKNCYEYLKDGKKMIIDMNKKYVNNFCTYIEPIGFKLVSIENYNIKKSHYSKKKFNKQQSLITFSK